MRPKTVLVHVGVTLAVVLAYEHYKANGVPSVKR